VSERIIPPQEELQRELEERAAAEAPSKCPRCGTPRQRFLRRCPQCRRRYWSLFGNPKASTDFPAHWARRDD
jgi:lipopolysaccharide biosynthesis regulator YciM